MIRRRTVSSIALTAILLSLVGCHPQQPMYLFEDGDLSHWVGESTRIEYPDADINPIPDVDQALSPLTLQNPDPNEIWDLSLQDAVRIALENSKVMRSLGGVAYGPAGAQGEPSAMLSQPGAAMTMYDPALVSSDPRYGPEAALAAFDGQFSTHVFWSKGDAPQNTSSLGFRPPVHQTDVGTFQAQLSKYAATGGQFTLSHNWQYSWDNTPDFYKQWPSAWTVNLEGGFRQPLLQGGGVSFNRIAGPGAVPGFYNGVMIARLREDVTLNDFEIGVRNVVYDVERSYWNLYYMYRRLDSVRAGRDSALQTWRVVRAKADSGGVGGSAKDLYQAQQQYFIFRAEVERTLSNLYKTENSLRWMMGIAATDGRLIRPSDEPTTAKVTRYDWQVVLGEAICRSPELRRQRWTVKQRELELQASKNFLLPKIDLTGKYRWLGMGEWLIEPQNSHSNAYGNMADGRFAEWDLGLELSVPLGFRKELAGVRNAHLQLAKVKAVLQEQELELSHQLASAMRDLDEYYTISETTFNRRIAAEGEVAAIDAAYKIGTTTIDQLLDAQRRLAEAETEFFRSVVDYNIAIAQIEFRKGSLLEYNGISLAEGPWPQKAYFDALRLARQRDASIYFNYGFTRPNVISRGEYHQHAGPGGAMNGEGFLMEDHLFESPLDWPMTPIEGELYLPGVPAGTYFDQSTDAQLPAMRHPAANPRTAARPVATAAPAATPMVQPLAQARPGEMSSGLHRLAGTAATNPVQPTSYQPSVSPAQASFVR